MEDRTLLSTLVVTNLHDSGAGSLRAAVAAADAEPSAAVITFAKGLKGTIPLSTGELLITNSVTINGPGASNLAVSGTGTSRVFEILAGQNVTVTGLTITRGYAPDEGAGILNDGSNLTLSGDIVSQMWPMRAQPPAPREGVLRVWEVGSRSRTRSFSATRRRGQRRVEFRRCVRRRH